MKKMKIEKQLIFADQVQRIVSLNVSEHLTYRHEDDGIRAMGPLYIKGQYEGSDGIEDFQETLEMDVLAPQDKLSGEDFHLQIADYQGSVHEDTINVIITMDIYGLKDDQNDKKQAQPHTSVEPNPTEDDAIPTVQAQEKQTKDIPPTIPKPMDSPSVERVVPQVIEEETKEEAQVQSVDGFDDMFCDAESTYTSYRIIVAKPNDTYSSIATRYDVDETALRDTNKNKDILPKTLVILPFQQN